MIENKLSPDGIYNIDETGLTTLQVPGKVLSTLAKKQVGATKRRTSDCLLWSQRPSTTNVFLNCTVSGAKGVAIKPGYMNSELFVKKYLPHFIKHATCSNADSFDSG
ncbi:unnamed protein product [Lepeophtheirus salmonis]|uniref:(salmon louse) hypothetical protein n=1 Tax=Lepeophtheirus salmonis TaxID=72036 RepID=A0A7R8D005_LEPSM|nr:unnamed protein product [Lepeophtheirus salmonis]CAF2979883.1 unnamed protein product [Lepeophtheirus salmonis]